MRNLVRIPVLVVGLLLFAAPAALAGDLEDVQAVFKQGLAGYNAKDINATFGVMHDQAVSFGANAPFAGDSTAVRRQGAATFFANLESVNVNPVNFQFRVFGDTAVAWGYYAAVVKAKDGPMEALFTRATQVYAKLDGKWVLVSFHMSYFPPGS